MSPWQNKLYSHLHHPHFLLRKTSLVKDLIIGKEAAAKLVAQTPLT